MGKMNFAKLSKKDSLRKEGSGTISKRLHMQALRKAYALWKRGLGPKPVWDEGR